MFLILLIPFWNISLLDPIMTTMVLTAGQTTAFFENNDQMGILHALVIQLQPEGIDNIDNLADLSRIRYCNLLTISDVLEGKYPIPILRLQVEQ